MDDWIRQTGDQGQFPEDRVMPWDRDRTEVDGWCTQSSARAFKQGGSLVVQCTGKNARMERAVVAPGGPMVFEFRARSSSAAVTSFAWSLITDIRNPENRRPVTFVADGEWRQHAVSFTAADDLAILSLGFGETPGRVEFDWIRLKRADGALVRVWEFR